MEELRPLWSFVQVARHGSLTAAAQVQGLSPAALSKSISRLERRLQTPLFTRTPRGLQLTYEGRRLFEQLDTSFSDIQGAVRGLQQEHGVPSGTVRLSTVTAFGRNAVMPLLPSFFAKYPQVDVVMSLHDGARGMSRNAYDVRINWGEEREQGKVAHRLCGMPLILVASPAYLAASGTPKTLKDLDTHECICTSVNGSQRARWQFTRRQRNGARSRAGKAEAFQPRGRLIVVDELDAVAVAAVAGLGLTLISADNIVPELASGALVRVMADHDITGLDIGQTEIILQHSQRRLMTPGTRALVDFLIDRLKDRRPA